MALPQNPKRKTPAYYWLIVLFALVGVPLALTAGNNNTSEPASVTGARVGNVAPVKLGPNGSVPKPLTLQGTHRVSDDQARIYEVAQAVARKRLLDPSSGKFEPLTSDDCSVERDASTGEWAIHSYVEAKAKDGRRLRYSLLVVLSAKLKPTMVEIADGPDNPIAISPVDDPINRH